MVEYSKVNVKLTDTKLKKLKTPVKTKTGTTLRMSLKIFDRNDQPHELLLTTRQETKLRNAELTKYRLNEISNIENYFNQEINQRKLCSQKLNKYVPALDYIDKVLIVLSATSDGVCNISSVNGVGTPVGIVEESFTLIFSLTTGITKKLLSIIRSKKK